MSSLNQFGYNFQIKVLSSLLTNRIFYLQIQDVLYSDYFESDANRNLLGFIKEYYTTYSIAPTKDAFKVHIQGIKNEVLKLNVLEHLKDVFNSVGSLDLQYIQDQSIVFCKRQEFKKAIEEAAVLIEDGRYEDAQICIDKAHKVGQEKFNFYDYKAEVKPRYEEADRTPISTSWDIINDITAGGLAAGELGILVAGPGGGKSWGLVNIGGAAVKAGKTVFHFTLELYENYTGRRYDSFFSGIAFQNLKYNVVDIEHCISKLPGNIVIEYAPAGTLTINQIQAHIDKAILNGVTPDLIIIDYADLLRGNGRYAKKEKREELGNIYIDLRGLAGKYKIPCWTASQANREGAKSDIIDGTQVSEDYSKIMTGDLVISLQRKLQNKLGGTGTWHIIKNRFGPDGLTFPSKINTSNGSIQIFEENTVQGKQTKIAMQGDDLIRKSLASKFQQMQGSSNKSNLTKF